MIIVIVLMMMILKEDMDKNGGGKDNDQKNDINNSNSSDNGKNDDGDHNINYKMVQTLKNILMLLVSVGSSIINDINFKVLFCLEYPSLIFFFFPFSGTYVSGWCWMSRR